jgi:hypothetical protein
MIGRIKKLLLHQIHKSAYKPGHYYSPIPDVREISAREESVFATPDTIDGVDLNLSKQRDYLLMLKPLINDTKFSTIQANDYYYTDNGFFVESDALYYQAILRNRKPRRLIEIGSGFSSAVLYDVIRKLENYPIVVNFVEPYPARLLSLLQEEKHGFTLHRKSVQQIPVDIFKTLEEGDILFIDSSHISKVGSDVNFLLFNVLPILKPGVLVHFHDILFPFEYPKEWIYAGRFWNEAYLLKAFLMFNRDFSVVLFNDYLIHADREFLASVDPRLLSGGGSIWLIRN